jgi:hypothetical protein
MTGARRGHSSRRGGVLSPRIPTASRMVLQCPEWRRGGGDGHTGLTVTEETRFTGPTLQRCSGRAWNMPLYPFRGLRRPLFEGAALGPYESGWYSVTELTPALPHSVVQWRGWPHREGRRNSVGIGFPGVSEVWCGFVFDLGPCMCQNIKCLGQGEQIQGRRARKSLERGGDSLEGASSPRARRSLTRGGVRPSSEAQSHPRGHPALERGGVSLVRYRTPRAKRSFARGWLGLTALAGRWGRQDRGPLLLIHDCFGRVLRS